jgi:hypothetical protein
MAEFVRRGTEWKTNGVLKQTRQGIFDDRGYKITDSIAEFVYFVPYLVVSKKMAIKYFYDFTQEMVPFTLACKIMRETRKKNANSPVKLEF